METSVVPQNKTHTWTLVLLVWVIALLIFVAGYLIYRGQTGDAAALSSAQLADACADAVNDRLGILEEEKGDDAATTCATTDTYNGTIGPSFSYPIDWEVVAQAIEGRTSTIIRVSKDPLWLCNGCDGPNNAINVEVLPNTDKATLDDFVEERYGEKNIYGFSKVTKGTTTINGTLVFSAKGQFDGMGSGPFEEIIALTPHTIVIASLNNWESDPDTRAAWDVVTSSLDFSKIE